MSMVKHCDKHGFSQIAILIAAATSGSSLPGFMAACLPTLRNCCQLCISWDSTCSSSDVSEVLFIERWRGTFTQKTTQRKNNTIPKLLETSNVPVAELPRLAFLFCTKRQ